MKRADLHAISAPGKAPADAARGVAVASRERPRAGDQRAARAEPLRPSPEAPRRTPWRHGLVFALAVAATWGPGCGRGGRDGQMAPVHAAPSESGATVDVAYQILDESLRSGQVELQCNACETYIDAGRRPPPGMVEPLVDSRDPRLRMMAVTLLGTLRNRQVADVFRRKRRDADPAVRLAAAFGLAMTLDPQQMTALRDALGEPNVALRRTAAWLLGLTGNKTAVGMLKVKLDDPDAVVVLRVAEALHRLGSEAGRDRVRTLSGHSRHTIRYYATRLLGRLGEQEDIPLLERLCQSRFLDVKFAAIAALARLGDFKRIGMLVEMLEAPQSDTRVLAARELGETGYTPALNPLEQMLRSEVPRERTTAAISIVRIRSAEESWRSRILEEEAADDSSD